MEERESMLWKSIYYKVAGIFDRENAFILGVRVPFSSVYEGGGLRLNKAFSKVVFMA